MRASAPEKPKGAAWLVLGAAVLWLALTILLPLISVFVEAFRQGSVAYFAAFRTPTPRPPSSCPCRSPPWPCR